MKKKPLNVGHSKQSNKVKTHLNHNMQSEYQAKQYKTKINHSSNQIFLELFIPSEPFVLFTETGLVGIQARNQLMKVWQY